ncbi:MAG TPA: conjugal transfer protein TraO [Candidatus Paraprevotella stercorigallinarum]|nr:conjugal transfer protein TraO [Candidatus Paraprevotella stercorigallinarum]
MKRLMSILFAILVLGGTAMGQRLLPMQRGLEITGGVPLQKQGIFKDGNFTVGMDMVRYIRGYNYYHYGVSYSQQAYHYVGLNLPVRNYLADGGFMFHLVSDPGKNILVYAGAYATLGYEEVNDGQKLLPDGARLNARNRFIYGGGAQLSLEGFITDHLLLFAKVRGHFLGGTDLDLFRPSTVLGIRIIM